MSERAVGLRLRHVLLRTAARLRPKRISAMVRVRNEEEFLAAVRSIIDCVEEVVIVDNASTDATPAVIASLQADYADRVVAYHYPHAIARVGSETWRLLAASGGRSPRLSGTYYNWCLRRCTQPFVLKWDGDMLATPAFYRALDAWRGSPAAVLLVQGANVHPDLRHLAASRSSDRAALLAQQQAGAAVINQLRDSREPRCNDRHTDAARLD